VADKPLKQRAIDALQRAVQWGEKIPRGLRTLLGIPLILAGFVGFLPILGFWMLPLGAALIALDVPPWRRRLLRWLEERSSTPSGR
jgi:hypothetical protein